MRPYRDSNLNAIVDLWNACEAVDQTGIWETVEGLRQAFNSPKFNQAEDLGLWENRDGLAGYGSVWIKPTETGIDGYLSFRVHPTVRNQGFEEEIMSWGEQRIRQVAEDSSGDVKLYTSVRTDRGDLIPRLQDFGFIAVRYFFYMKRDLTQPIPEPQFPEGYSVRTVEPEQDGTLWVEMFNQTFIDHWNHHDLSVEEYLHESKDPNYCSELDLIAIAPDGTFAAFCGSAIYPEDNQRNGREEGWIEVLGTRRGFRFLGLGRAMLLSGIHCLKAKGMDIAVLGVDSENPSGALGLYQSIGFEKVQTHISYMKNL